MEARVSISRGSDGKVRIRIRDVLSGIEFVEVSLSIENYGFLVTGLSEVEAIHEVNGLEFVGKKRITEKRSIDCPVKTYDRAILKRWLSENAKEDGWLLNTYLGAQNSVSYRDGKTIINYSVTRYE